MPRPAVSLQDVLLRFEKVHGDTYDYSDLNYVNTVLPLSIICKKHGVFYQSVGSHVRGRGCKQCMQEKQKYTHESLIEKFNQIHNYKFTYSLEQYKNVKSYISITCPSHGVFEQRADAHIAGNGCRLCVDESKASIAKDLISKFEMIHKHKYDYSKMIYKNTRTKIVIVCDKHGDFEQTPSCHLQGKGCLSCKESKGEASIASFLDQHDISYQREYQLCKNPHTNSFLRVDFYLPDFNMCIEYDGMQHFKEVAFWSSRNSLINNQKRDHLKNTYCKKNKIKMLRIPYTEYKNINLILCKSLKIEI